ncbi:MAG TPA: alkaline phosphatase family protein [Planctomycetota bacterium]|nr:alkaline phosphatase family protein [Planctomycetota bacterium]
MRRLLVVSCAALGIAEARRAGLGKLGQLLEVEPVFPALTVPAQAALLTGLPPAGTGAVGNGFYQRELRRAYFWEQSAELVSGERIWERLERESGAVVRAALLFFQNSVGSAVEMIVTPAPLHGPDGKTLPACYALPAGLDRVLESRLGPFPLHHYWGPMAGLPASKWIAGAAAQALTLSPSDFGPNSGAPTEAAGYFGLPVGATGIGGLQRGGAPDLIFVYLPHLDYDLQRFGPDSPQAAQAGKDLCGLLNGLAESAERAGYELVVVGDYAIEAAGGVSFPNRVLREAGLLDVRRVGPFELPDLGTSAAFAVADHQVAHVYCQNGQDPEEVAEALRGASGVARVLDRLEQAGLNLDHPRSGDLVLEAAPGHWFAYDWWTDEAFAPPYAKTVDIHSKPGYDPLELFFAPDRKGTARDASLIKGTHGRSGGGKAALIVPDGFEPPAGPIKYTDLAGMLVAFATS